MENPRSLAFGPADILLPLECEYSKWSVVACDQFTSQPEYWERVERTVGMAPSTLRMVLPENCLDGPNVETDILDINNTMTKFLREGRFREFDDALIYVERTQSDGRVRKGLVGKIDLERYDYEPDSEMAVRATEGTVMSRIPPRVAVRKNAPIELPHVMLLFDDPQRTVIGPLAARKGKMKELYNFDLMENGGHVSGWLLDRESMALVLDAFAALNDPEAVKARYGVDTDFQFAVGDGNHSLATAKECYERQKQLHHPESWASLPSRYALCEVVDLYDDALDFKPIHRVLFDVKGKDLLKSLLAYYPDAYQGQGAGHVLRYVCGGEKGCVTVPHPKDRLVCGTLQTFLDDYMTTHSGSIDYIHGDDVALDLGSRQGNMAFFLPPMDKKDLFPAVLRDGVLPRKTFSMGEARDKRYYLEARRIR